MRALFLIPALLVAGCAAPPTAEQVRAVAARAPDYNLCSSVMVDPPSVSIIAQEEISRRHLDCAPYAAAIAQQIAAQQAANANTLNQALLLMQAGRPYYPNPVTSCSTRFIGGSWQTLCY